jgi:PAS domain S-box-containing protein
MEAERTESPSQLNEERFRTSFAYAAIGLAITDLAGEFLEVNDAYCSLTGYSEAELLRLDFNTIVHPDDLPLSIQKTQALLAGDVPAFVVEERYVKNDGSLVWVVNSVSLMLDAEGRPQHLVRLTQDITDRKRTEAEFKEVEESLRKADRRYRDIFDNAGEGIFQTTPDGRFATANPALARILGFDSPKDLLLERTDIAAQQYLDPVYREEFKRLLDEHDSVRGYEYEAYRKDGEKIWLSDSVRAVRDEGGALLYYEGIAEDITERKRAEIRSLAFATLARRLSGARVPLDAAQVIADTASDLFGWDSCVLKMYDADRDLLTPMLNIDTVAGRRVDVTALIADSEPTPRIRRLIERGAELVLRPEPFEFDETSIPFGDQGRPSAAIMGVPIRHSSAVIGILSIYSYRSQAYDNQMLGDLQSLADHCGEALNRIRAESSLRESEARQRATLGAALDCVITTNDKGVIVDYNPAAERTFGFRREEAIGREMAELIIPARLREQYHRGMDRYLKTGKSRVVGNRIEMSALNAEGSEFPIELAIARIELQGAPMFTAYLRDITERKQAGEALKLFRALLDQSSDAIEVIDPLSLQFIDCNESAHQTLGYSREEFLSLTVFDVDPLVNDKMIVESHEEMAKSGFVIFESVHRRKDGSTFPVEVNLKLVRLEREYRLAVVRDISERKLVEEARRQNEQQYEYLVNSIEGIVWEIDPETFRFLVVSKQAERILGYPLAQWLADSDFWVSHIHPDDCESAVALRVEACLRHEGYQLEYRMIAADGRVVWFKDNVTVGVSSNDAVRVRGVMVDITERKRAEELLVQSESRFRMIFNTEPECVKLLDANGCVLQMNAAGLAMIEADSLDQVAGHCVYPLVSEPYRAAFVELINQVFRGVSGVLEFEILGLKGTRRCLETHAAPVRAANGEITALISVTRDITERKDAGAALRESEERYRELFENARDAIYVHDLDGTYTSVNRAAERLSGHTREEILGQNFTDFVSKKHWREVRENLCRKLDEEGETTYEVEVMAKDGRTIPVEVRSRLIYQQGVAVGVQGTARDITERRRANEVLQFYSRRLIEVQEAERQRIARELHDQIGQVLTAAQINLHSVRRICDTQEASARVADSIKVLDEALDQVRNLSLDLRPSLLDDLGLVPALRWYVARQAQRTGVPAEVVAMVSDQNERYSRELETACFRIVQEALTNVARHARPNRVLVQIQKDQRALVLRIKDDGVGFDVNALRERAPSAATLGLLGMEERAQALGGTIEINSAPARGTEIRCTFPL